MSLRDSREMLYPAQPRRVIFSASRDPELALRKSCEAVSPPNPVIAGGACAIAGGPFVGHDQVRDCAASVVPVDVFIPGYPRLELAILAGLWREPGRRERP